MPEPLNLLLLCGGRSSEHEISVLSARSLMKAVDSARHTLHVIGISRSGRWYALADDDPVLTGGDDALTVKDDDQRPRAMLLDET
ncbi:D-alanine--D-alanine ligase A, partial [Gammaproteobacteria bacterium]|nr:D-alanine--D-alanine ligase A [Gammaproteobacteria bacterium]